MSLDETSFGRNGRDSKGYAPVGKALVVKRMNARMTTLSSLVAMTKECIISRKEVIGSFNTERFTCFLSNLTIGTVILLDNVRFHHSKVVKDIALSPDS